MIRFCDKEVICLEYGRINRSELISYFLNGHMNEPVCVVDDCNRYLGYITYHGLLPNTDIDKAISKERLTVNKDIWKHGRWSFAAHNKKFEEYILFPVVDIEQELVCFAYEDSDADRELRMLWELQENPNALQFADIYPECECVRIHGFNELAYFFAMYLKSQGISVWVEGSMWETFFQTRQKPVLDYQRMDIYAEGTLPKSADWMENLLRSVSVEFECIDHIYEENIKAGRIKDAGSSCGELTAYLKKVNEVVILGTDLEALDAYSYFRKEGVEVCCFAENQDDKAGSMLFGKPVLRLTDAMEQYQKAVFVDNHDQGSAWGMGKTDYFSYLGYKRNRDFFLLKDYMKIRGDGLKSALKDQKIALIGDFYLCDKLADYFERNEIFGEDKLRYISMQPEAFVKESGQLKISDVQEIEEDILCLIVIPEYIFVNSKEVRKKKAEIISYLISHGILNYTDYFSYVESFINIEEEIKSEYQIGCLKPKRIVLGSINSCSGNTFLRGLLDGHPSILMMDYGYFNNNLFWFCVRLSGKKPDEILSLFLRLYELEWKNEKIENIDLFLEKMRQLMDFEKSYTSQELFVIFHIAYMYMYRKDIKNLEDTVIYWEAHFIERHRMEDWVQWLGTENVQCDIINVVRNLCMKNGSYIKGILDQNWDGRGSICQIALSTDDFEKKDYVNSQRLVIRFEDLKCKPEEEIQKICRVWEIPWSESLMHTSVHGEENIYDNGNKKIKDFDLTPVYNTYEEYFSEFDRFRITLICMLYQKRHGYPYVDVSLFSRKELQEMFLKEFRFMERLYFDTERTRKIFYIRFQNYIRGRIQNLIMSTE